MSPLSVVIVDDEPVAVRRVAALLRAQPDVEVSGTAANASQALELVARCTPDLALLDIEMPGLDGISLAHRLQAVAAPPSIVFVTAFGRFALDAFDVRATDYLLKPVEPQRLAEAIARARSERESHRAAQRIADLEEIVCRLRALEHHAARAGSEALWLASGQGQDKVVASDITWIQAERDYVRVHTAAKSYFVRGRLGEMERRLSGHGLVRVHRSAMVQAAAVLRVELHGERGYRLILADGTIVEASRRFGARVRAMTA